MKAISADTRAAVFDADRWNFMLQLSVSKVHPDKLANRGSHRRTRYQYA